MSQNGFVKRQDFSPLSTASKASADMLQLSPVPGSIAQWRRSFRAEAEHSVTRVAQSGAEGWGLGFRGSESSPGGSQSERIIGIAGCRKIRGAIWNSPGGGGGLHLTP